MRNLEVMINEQRRSSVHLNMDTLDNNQPIVTERTLNHSTERRSRRSGVNCSFTAYYGRKSPVAKRRREEDKDDSRKMKTIDYDPIDDPSYETETLILSEITEIVKEKEINEIISKFSPVIRNFPDQIKKEMLESTVDLIERKNMFIGAIKYVIKGRDEPSKESELEEASIERLSEILIREIENRMPKSCRQCNKYYIVKPTDCPELHCMGCKVGMHDCTKMNLMKGRPGIKWLCETCEPIFTMHYLPKFDSTAIFEGFEINNLHNNTVNKVKENEKEIEIIVSQETVHPVKPIRKPIKISNKKVMEQKEMDIIQVVAEIHRTENGTKEGNGTNHRPVPQTNTVPNSNPNYIDNNIESHDRSGSSTNYRDMMRYPNMNKDKICRYLTRGLCRYGARGENELGKCQRYHPSQCKKYNENGITENGCKEGNKCHNWHATYICRLSADKNLCSRPNCRYKHHKNCATTGNSDYDTNNFLAYNQQHNIPRHQGPQPSRYNKKQSQHQQHYISRRSGVNHQTVPRHRQWQNSQMSPAAEKRLVHLIRTIIQEERSW